MRSFQSAPPTRGATIDLLSKYPSELVSIRAPHAGGDAFVVVADDGKVVFQSAPPTRGATVRVQMSRVLD